MPIRNGPVNVGTMPVQISSNGEKYSDALKNKTELVIRKEKEGREERKKRRD